MEKSERSLREKSQINQLQLELHILSIKCSFIVQFDAIAY